MLAKERQNEIFSIISQTGTIKMSEIVEKFQVSHETARRDLEFLQDKGLLKRVYGGAILADDIVPGQLAGATSNKEIHSPEREAIGREAAKLVKDGDTVLLSVGSTILQIAKNLYSKKNITVLTNSIFVLNELINTDVCLYVLGGCVNNSEYDMEGQLAMDALKNFCVDIAFICAGGITKDFGVSDYSCEVAQINKEILNRARKTVLVAPSKKFGIDSFSVTCSLTELDTVISDNKLSPEYISHLEDSGIKLLLAEV